MLTVLDMQHTYGKGMEMLNLAFIKDVSWFPYSLVYIHGSAQVPLLGVNSSHPDINIQDRKSVV